MKRYAVTITESLQRTVEAEANSPAEAEEIVEERWNKSQYILSAEDFTGVCFTAKAKQRDRSMER